MKYCRYCGKPIDDDSTFCTHCGKGQSVHNNYISVEKFGDIVSRIWSKTKNPKTKFVFPKGSSNTTFVRIKKWIKRIVIILIVATILGLFVLLGFWLYGFYLTSKWTREDERREIISMKDISKADSIVRVLFQEYADGTHRYDFDGDRCNYSHVEKGIEILRNAAEKGDASAQFTLGCIYDGARYDSNYQEWDNKYTMLGSEIDHERAAYWYSQSANQGVASAMGNLANSYRYGCGVEKDFVKATELMKKAAEKGNAWAQLNYGDMFRDGEVCFRTKKNSNFHTFSKAKPNIKIAKAWWQKALSNGNATAKERLEHIYTEENNKYTEFTSPLGDYSYEPDDYTNGYNWKNEPHGVGTARFKDGRVYHGSFSDGILEGENSTFTFTNGDYFEGTFNNNEFYQGKYIIKEDSSYFIGIFKEGKPQEGQWFDKDGSLIRDLHEEIISPHHQQKKSRIDESKRQVM